MPEIHRNEETEATNASTLQPLPCPCHRAPHVLLGEPRSCRSLSHPSLPASHPTNNNFCSQEAKQVCTIPSKRSTPGATKPRIYEACGRRGEVCFVAGDGGPRRSRESVQPYSPVGKRKSAFVSRQENKSDNPSVGGIGVHCHAIWHTAV